MDEAKTGKNQRLDASTVHADLKLDELRQRVAALENVKTVVTIKTRSSKSSP